ncbi:MAG TPA: hypothetical protein VIU64_04420 [Polyangia bacterium]
MRLGEHEGRLRSLLALAIFGCVGLAAWTGGCGRDTIVQPDAGPDSAPGSDGPAGVDGPGGGETGDGPGANDLGGKDLLPNEDAQPSACCSGSEAPRCLTDTQQITCLWRFDSPKACLDDPAFSSYGHVWFVYQCDKGCEPATGTCRR